MKLDDAIKKAQVLAITSQSTKLVVELDEAEDRKIAVVSEDYPRYDEFAAFDGKILAEIASDGSVTYWD